MKSIKNSGYSCFLKIKHIYARHDSQNSWILDTSLMEALLTVLV